MPDDIKALVLCRLDEIRSNVVDQSQPIEPVFCQMKEGHVIAMDWCEGFMDAVKQAPDAWHNAIEMTEGSKLMQPILVHMSDDHGNSLFGLGQALLVSDLGN